MDEIEKTILNIKGITHIKKIPKELYPNILEIEKKEEKKIMRKIGNTYNSGLRKVLNSGNGTYLALHDCTFRGPPEPTCILKDFNGNLLGIEIISNEFREYFGSFSCARLDYPYPGFIILSKEEDLKGIFEFPTIPFPEITNGISASPSFSSDKYLRNELNLDNTSELASLLITCTSF